MTTLTDQILNGETVDAAESKPTLADVVLSSPQSDLPKKVEEFNIQKEATKQRGAFTQGINDVLNSVGSGIGFIDKNLIPGGEKRNQNFQDRVKKENTDFEEANPKGEGLLPTAAEGGRMAGQLAATAPLMPVKAFNALSGVMRALPTVAATGEKIAAPLVNRLAASTITGAAGGAEYGALTSSSNDESLLENTGKGLITGALAAPVLTTVATAAQKTLPTLKKMWANVQIGKLARDAGMEPAAVKNVLDVLENAGYSPKEAQIKLNQMGPQATLADLSSSIQAEAGGLASFGGKPTEILKGRYEARAKTANSEAHDIMETKLGPKPDIEAEKEAIIKQVQKDVDPDYKAAYASGKVADIQPLVDNINKQLETAVGPKASGLKQIKEYLYKNVKDAQGNDIKVLKHSTEELHEIRQAIDDVVNDKNPTTSYGKNALRSINDVRSGVDDALKTIPEMAAADTKFASKMQIVKDINIGENVLKNGMNKEEFARYFDNLNPERQAAVKKGMRSNIGDLMDKASRGELSEAQRLFGKNSVNRANLEKVFGNDGAEVLDALEKQAMLRGTERSISARSHTAEGQAIQRKYGERNDGGGAGQIVHGAILDAVTGTPGAATAIMTAKRIGGHVKLQMSGNSRERLIEGTADLLSRQGIERNVGLDVANKAHKINNLISRDKLPVSDLPTYLFSAPIGEGGYSTYKKLGKE